MSNFNSAKSIILKGVRLTWADIFKPGEAKDGFASKFKVTALMEPGSEAVTLAKKAMVEAATGLWQGNAVNVIKAMGANSKCVRNGNDKLDDQGNIREEYKDMLFISAGNKAKPRVVAQTRVTGKFKCIDGTDVTVANEFVEINENGTCSLQGRQLAAPPYKITVPYRGCFVNLKVQLVAGKQFKGNDGVIVPNQVYAKIEAVQFVRDGDPFGSGPSSAEGFEDEEAPALATAGGADDPFGEDMDELAF